MQLRIQIAKYNIKNRITWSSHTFVCKQNYMGLHSWYFPKFTTPFCSKLKAATKSTQCHIVTTFKSEKVNSMPLLLHYQKKKKKNHASGGGPYGFSLASILMMSSGFLPSRADKTYIQRCNKHIKTRQRHKLGSTFHHYNKEKNHLNAKFTDKTKKKKEFITSNATSNGRIGW